MLGALFLDQNHSGNSIYADTIGNRFLINCLCTGFCSIDTDIPITLRECNSLCNIICIENYIDTIISFIFYLTSINPEGNQLVGCLLLINSILHLICCCQTQCRMCFTESNQALVIFRICSVFFFFQIIPFDGINRIGSVVAVLPTLVTVHLLTEHFLPGMDERNTLRGHIDGSCQIVHLNNISINCRSMRRDKQLINQ